MLPYKDSQRISRKFSLKKKCILHQVFQISESFKWKRQSKQQLRKNSAKETFKEKLAAVASSQSIYTDDHMPQAL